MKRTNEAGREGLWQYWVFWWVFEYPNNVWKFENWNNLLRKFKKIKVTKISFSKNRLWKKTFFFQKLFNVAESLLAVEEFYQNLEELENVQKEQTIQRQVELRIELETTLNWYTISWCFMNFISITSRVRFRWTFHSCRYSPCTGCFRIPRILFHTVFRYELLSKRVINTFSNCHCVPFLPCFSISRSLMEYVFDTSCLIPVPKENLSQTSDK